MSQDLAQWTTGRLLVTAARRVQHVWEQFLRAQGISHAGFTILEGLQAGPLPQRELARESRVTDQTISRSIERLQGCGLVTRSTDPEDERRQLVSITDEGRRLHRKITEQVASSTVISAPVGDVDQLRTALTALIESLDGPDNGVYRVP